MKQMLITHRPSQTLASQTLARPCSALKVILPFNQFNPLNRLSLFESFGPESFHGSAFHAEGTRGAVSSKIPAIGVPWLPGTPLEHRQRA